MTYSSCSGNCSYGSGCSGTAAYNSSAASNYHGLESAIITYDRMNTLETAVETSETGSKLLNNGVMQAIHSAAYNSNNSQKQDSSYSARTAMEYFSPEPFLKPDREVARFIGKGEDIRHYVEEIFEAVAGKKLPEDIVITVVSKDELKKKHIEFGGIWNDGIQGFSINRKGFSESLIVAKENELDRLLITIGHELGHVLEFALNNRHDEEAKAFAFEMAWIKAIHNNNIAGLKENINLNPMPAENGLHNIAFDFVRKLMQSGKKTMEIYKELIMGMLKVNEDANMHVF